VIALEALRRAFINLLKAIEWILAGGRTPDYEVIDWTTAS